VAAPIVGEKIIGMRCAWRSFQAPINRSTSSSTWASVARPRCRFSFLFGLVQLDRRPRPQPIYRVGLVGGE